MFESGFPCELQETVHKVLGVISMKTYNDISEGYTDEANNEKYLLLDGSTISFPYRLYFIDDENVYNELASKVEKCIYDCIFTRSCDGYIRQKHLNNLFQVFCANNPYMFRYAYSRMTSYWNEFYREKCYIFHNYVGYKLYKECFGYTGITGSQKKIK